MKRSRTATRAISSWLPATLVTIAGCAVNPATGERQLILVSEGQEIEMGRAADQQISASMPPYDDQALQQYVSTLGQELAARSERPELPWSFKVLDDPVVNAFALPGGFIYITRGIMAHFQSEAQLASVLGHEIGHVTARHGVEQMSRAQLAQVGLGVTTILRPDLQTVTGIAGAGLGLLFLKYGRDDERQADDLGLRYLLRANYDPRPMPDVFALLARVSQASGGGGRTPAWLSTHPDPANRQERITSAIAELNLSYEGRKVGEDSYLDRLDGVVYGDDPRNGFFDESRFLHPDLAFQIDFPIGWQTANQRDAVLAGSPNQDAIMQLSLSRSVTVSEASREFQTQEGIQLGEFRSSTINGLPAAVGSFTAQTDQGALAGLVAFVDYGGNVYQILGYGGAESWGSNRGVVEGSIESFRELSDPAALSVEPLRLDIVTIERSMTLREFSERFPSEVSLERLALLNQVSEDTRFMAGSKVKTVVGN